MPRDALSTARSPLLAPSRTLSDRRNQAKRRRNSSNKKEADKAAASTLEDRNIVTHAIDKALRADIALAQTLAPELPPVQVSASEEALQIAAQKFNEWFRDWRTTASVGITRRDYRIMLGISQRKSSTESVEPTAPAPQK